MPDDQVYFRNVILIHALAVAIPFGAILIIYLLLR